ncbi:MAG: hypothetical protein KUA37_04825 [Desulfomicrobium sp.]|nr:hypothetical protein [Pseudomonadota bacterium]MBU4569987.1 hypothetical protein [Pseudomonadota bacterium]MBU4595086.1 hypothetical protein [Pseudomonadota bacterium]MBV1711316.1 hypothetical protein [Desulfomicrobium sp.]MBV1746970.1 hypothetical protein [Desulfomicrobium sp.]
MIAALLAFCGLGLILAAGVGRTHPRIWLGLNFSATLCGLYAAVTILLTGETWLWRGGLAQGGEIPRS